MSHHEPTVASIWVLWKRERSSKKPLGPCFANPHRVAAEVHGHIGDLFFSLIQGEMPFGVCFHFLERKQ